MRKTILLALLMASTDTLADYTPAGPIPSRSFRMIEGGEFTMGSPRNEVGRYMGNSSESDEEQREVTISRAFYMMDKEVTQEQWFRIMKKNPSRFSTPEDCDNHLYQVNIDGEEDGICPDLPVEKVSWNETQEFIEKINEGLTDCQTERQRMENSGCYRLPTEAEWEYAARGEMQTAYFFEEDSSELGRYAWYSENAGERTHPVGLKEKNPFGLYDIYGNVWEWVQDNYAEKLPGGTDPLHGSSGSFRVIRGGSWYSNARDLRSANRNYVNPDNRYYGVGFRLVRTR